MNICVVTVYNSENCGSFYQAYALKSILERLGHKVVFLRRETRGTSHRFTSVAINCVKDILRNRPMWAMKNLCKYVVFEKNISRRFRVLKYGNKAFAPINCFVIGSDTLWNFDDSYFRRKKNIYCGLAFGNKRKFTYAVSMSDTDPHTILNDGEIVNGIRQFNATSVRDERTQETAAKVLGYEPPIVLDPTLLLDEKEYYPLESDIKLQDFILIYGFGAVPKEIQSELLTIKAEKNCKIVSYGQYRKWADINTIYDPSTFLSYFHKAKYVVTDTFHGSIFSIIYKKSFVCYGQKKNKVRSLLQSFSLSDRFVEPGESTKDKLDKLPNYGNVYALIAGFRNKSMKFLEENTRSVRNEVNI